MGASFDAAGPKSGLVGSRLLRGVESEDLGGKPSSSLPIGVLPPSDPFDKQESFLAKDGRLGIGKTESSAQVQQAVEENEQLVEDGERLFKGSFTPQNPFASATLGAKSARGQNAIEATRERRIPDNTIEKRNLNLGTRQGSSQTNTGKQDEAPRKLGLQSGSLPYRPGGEGGFFVTVV